MRCKVYRIGLLMMKIYSENLKSCGDPIKSKRLGDRSWLRVVRSQGESLEYKNEATDIDTIHVPSTGKNRTYLSNTR